MNRHFSIRPALLRSLAAVVPLWASTLSAVDAMPVGPVVPAASRSLGDQAFSAARRAGRTVSHWLRTPQNAEAFGRIFQGSGSLSRDQLAGLFENETGACRLELRSHRELFGAFGAFAPQGANGRPTLYLNADWLRSGAPDAAVQRVLVEEMGHLIDHLVHPGIDSLGDEGQLFAATVFDTGLAASTTAAAAEEDDSFTLSLDGTAVEVEMAALLFTAQSYFLAGDGKATLEQNQPVVGPPVPGQRFLFMSDPESAFVFSGNNVRGTLYAVDANNKIVGSYFGEISRLLKTGSTVTACQFFVYQPGQTSAPGNTTPQQTIMINLSATLFNGLAINTSSDPVDAALNKMMHPNVAPVAGVDSGSSVMPDCAKGGSATDATGKVILNDTDANISYSIDRTVTPNKLVEAQDALSITWVTNTSNTGTTTPLATVGGVTSATSAGSYGTLVMMADGSYTYTVDVNDADLIALPANQSVTDRFTYGVTDGRGGNSTSTLTVSVAGGNNAPVAEPDFNLAEEGAPGPQATGGVLGNDSGGDPGDGFLVTEASQSQTIATTPTAISPGVTTATGNAILSYNSLTLSAVGGIAVGDQVIGTGVLADTYVATVTSGTKTITLRKLNGTPAYAAVPLGANVTIGGTGRTIDGFSSPSPNLIGLSSPTGTVVPGMNVTGDGIAAGTTVLAVGTNYITLSQNYTAGTGSALATGDPLVFQADTTIVQGLYGYLRLKADGTYEYFLTADVPNAQVTNEYFSYRIIDSGGCTDTSVLHIQIQGAQNQAPVAGADSFVVVEAGGVANGTGATAPIAGPVKLLANDSQADGLTTTTTAVWTAATSANPLTVDAAGTSIQGLYGTLIVQPDGTYTYQVANADPLIEAMLPTTGTRTDVFFYRVTNSAGGVDVQSLTVTLQGANDAPVAADDGNYAIEGGGFANGSGGLDPDGDVLANDSDVDDGDTKTVTKAGTSSPTTPVGSGTPTAIPGLYGTLYLAADGSYSYVVDNANPLVDALGAGNSLQESFTYEMSDKAGLTDVADLKITILGADDTLRVSSIYVNEASPYAVFTVTGAAGQSVSLSLGEAVSLPLEEQASLSGSTADIGTQLQYFDPVTSQWKSYDPAALPKLGALGDLLVRVAVVQDGAFEGNQSFLLNATSADGTAAVGTGTIADDGSGDIFLSDNKTGTPSVPTDPGYPILDDDRQLSLSSPTVNEASPFAVFTVDGEPGQQVTLTLADGTAGSADYGSGLEVFDGTKWVPYTSGAKVTLDANGELLVRTPVKQDTDFENSETFTLTASVVGGATSSGTGTIKDDGTGDIFLADNKTGTPSLPTDPGYPVLDDDRQLSVSSPIVNEASPFAVFTVDGEPGQQVTLTLADGTAGSADYGPGLEVFDGTKWVTYTPGSKVTLDANGELLVRTPVKQDTDFENSEAFTLTATNTGGTPGTGTGTIKDDGTGDIFLADNKTGTPSLPTAPGYPELDDDRALMVSNVTVNEASPFAVFTVSGEPGQFATLKLTDGTAGSADYGSGLEVFDGTKWVPYSAGDLVALDGSGKLLVRTPVKQDTDFENSEAFTLTATNTGGTPGTGTGTIKDDGTGDIFLADNKTGTPSLPTAPGYPELDDDRALMVSNVTVNEASPFAVFTVSGEPGQFATLKLTDGTAGSADYGSGLEVFDGTKWVPYSAGDLVALDGSGKLLVRTPVQKDNLKEISETFTLAASNTGGTPAIGTADIRDDGSGDIFGPSGAPDPTAIKDDDRPLSVSSPVVNEGSPFAVFLVTGAPEQLASFDLADGTAGAADYGPTLEYFAGGKWNPYTKGERVPLDLSGRILVRTPVTADPLAEISEKFQLQATNNGGSPATGTAEIRDDGQGVVFGPTGDADPAVVNDDDRPLTVSNVTIHESLGHALFTVGGAQGQWVSLDLKDGSATRDSGDYGPALEYFDGDGWVAYSGQLIQLPADGRIQVRVPLKDDGVAEGLETFQLAARNTGYNGLVGEFRGTARVPDRVVELYVMENETSIAAYANHFTGYSQYRIVGGPEAAMFVPGPGSADLAFGLPVAYVTGGDNQHRAVAEAGAGGIDPDQALFIVNVMSFKAIGFTPLGPLQLDRQSGLYKQRIRISNLHVHEIGGLRFTVDLIPGARLFNANSASPGETPAIRYDGVLAAIGQPGSSIEATIEVLYQPLSSTNAGAGATLPNPHYRPDLIVTEASPPPPAPDSKVPTVSFVRLFNGDCMIEWDTVVGQTYAVEYSADLRNWIRVNPLIVANSHRTQWIDNGLPKTMSHPSAAGTRFYRVVLLK